MWSDEEQDALLRRFYLAAVSGMNTTERRKAVRDFASFSVELVAARGGPMTGERMPEHERDNLLEFVDAGHTLSDDQASAMLMEMDRARKAEVTQGATVATLQAKVAELEKALERYRNPRCQREECKRERARVDSLEKKVGELEALLKSMNANYRDAAERADLAAAKLDGLRQAIDDAVKRWGG